MAIAHDVPLGVLVTEYQTLSYLEQKVTMRNGLKVIHVNSYAKKVCNWLNNWGKENLFDDSDLKGDILGVYPINFFSKSNI